MKKDKTIKPKPPGYKFGRPTKYRGDETVQKVYDYLAQCVDKETTFHKTRGSSSDTYERIIEVNLPTIEALSEWLKLDIDTINEWVKHEEKHDFTVAVRALKKKQKDILIKNTLNGNYNASIAKLMLSSNHGMNEKTEIESKVEVKIEKSLVELAQGLDN